MSEEITIDNCLIDIFNFPPPAKIDSTIESMGEAKVRRVLKKLTKRSDKRLLEQDKNSPKIPKLDYFNDEDGSVCNSIAAISCHTVLATELCMHEVALPPQLQFTPLIPTTQQQRAKEYPFELDPFQVQATQCIDNNQSVMVSAHTSAGKTAVAEYAIATCLRRNQRVIYTTPIKALSNQKFNDFKDEFEDVGLMTGDTTINEDASCIVMTTEILRAMLYEGADMILEVGWVIFDEIHYMRDKERGYVWEESIILLSSRSAKFVFLSATIPNARQFAKWICFVHDQPCHVVYTESRPTPLEHYVFPANTGEIYRIVDTDGNIKEENFNKAMASLQKGAQTDDIVTAKGDVRANAAFDCFKLVKTIISNDFAPAIIFSFSKKECELYGKQTSKLSFTNKREQAKINEMIECALETVSEENRTLPSIVAYIPYLRKGIGIHHGGLIPLVKEITELLFGEGLVKVLFATETFAMGLNMPARTVLFTSLQKFDGKARRWITPGEYIQMSGRAGRRGKDDKGIVIMKVDDNVNTAIVKNYLKGKSDPINSAFHLTYNMVLNTLRTESKNPEDILRHSFFQFQNYAKLPDILAELKKRTKIIRSLKTDDLRAVEDYYKLSEKLRNLYGDRHNRMVECKRFKALLTHGRLVKVIHDGSNFGWCAVCRKPKNPKKKAEIDDTNVVILAKILLGKMGETNTIRDINLLRPPKSITAYESAVTTIPYTSIWEISTRVLPLPESLITSLTSRKISIRLIDECLSNYPKDKFFVDPVAHLFLKDPEFLTIVEDIAKNVDALSCSSVHTATNRDELLENAKTLKETQSEIDALREKLDETKGIAQMKELKNSRRVLWRMQFLTADDVITTKGSLACELSAGNELLLVEMIFDGQFKDLDAMECCALLSAFVCQDKGAKPPKLNASLENGLNQLQDTARRVAKVLWFCRLNDDEESFVQQFQPYLIEVVYYWCKGRSFRKICEKTTIFAGNIIRSLRRLEVLLRQMVKATMAVGMDEQAQKFTEAIKLMKRDIIAVDSLYTPA